jgi:hypothetical protein
MLAGSAKNWQVRSKKVCPFSIDMRYHPFVHLVTSAILVTAQNEASEEIDLGLINASDNTTDALGVSTTKTNCLDGSTSFCVLTNAITLSHAFPA